MQRRSDKPERTMEKQPKRHLNETITTRVSGAEYALIRAAARGERITPSALVRRIVVRELAGELTRRVAA
jgi:hypothetical protein